MRGAFRPLLTAFIVTGAMVVSSLLVWAEKLDAVKWFDNWMSIIAMMVGFFFGERSALKGADPEADRRREPTEHPNGA